jgi:DNA-binding NtrC family response regulator
LAAVIDRAAILGNGKRLEIAKALGVTHGPGAPRPSVAPAAVTAHPGVEEFPSLDAVATRHIETALRATRGRIEGPQGAAVMLGINPHTLRARMRKLGVNWKEFREGEPPG